MPALNKNNSAIKRIMQEARELANDPSTDYKAAPLEDDVFEWHCTLRGPPGTEFEGGLYHFRILLPAEYPFRPPSVMMLTPNGRFELNTKICISFTNYHEELWQPAWGVRTAIIGLQGFFPLKGQAAVGVGSIEYPPAERKRLAQLSRSWICPHCKVSNLELLPDPVSPEESGETKAVEMERQEDVKDADEKVDAVGVEERATTEGSRATTEPPSHTIVSQVQSVSGTPPDERQRDRLDDMPVTSPNREAGTGIATSPNDRKSAYRPPILLDGVICFLLVLLFWMIYRKVVLNSVYFRLKTRAMSEPRTPIPPSLVSSPYLNADIFKRESTMIHLPTIEDELWLGDTIPLASSSAGSSGSLRRHRGSGRPYRQPSGPIPRSPPIAVYRPHNLTTSPSIGTDSAMGTPPDRDIGDGPGYFHYAPAYPRSPSHYRPCLQRQSPYIHARSRSYTFPHSYSRSGAHPSSHSPTPSQLITPLLLPPSDSMHSIAHTGPGISFPGCAAYSTGGTPRDQSQCGEPLRA